MAKVSLCLAFAMVMMCVALHSVMGDENPWQAVIDEANRAGVSPETLKEAEKAIEDGSAQKAAEDALGSGSFNDWVQQASDMANKVSPSSEIPTIVLPDDEEELEESPAEAPSNEAKSPSEAPNSAPAEAPEPKFSDTEAPSPAQSPYASAPQA